MPTQTERQIQATAAEAVAVAVKGCKSSWGPGWNYISARQREREVRAEVLLNVAVYAGTNGTLIAEIATAAIGWDGES